MPLLSCAGTNVEEDFSLGVTTESKRQREITRLQGWKREEQGKQKDTQMSLRKKRDEV